MVERLLRHLIPSSVTNEEDRRVAALIVAITGAIALAMLLYMLLIVLFESNPQLSDLIAAITVLALVAAILLLVHTGHVRLARPAFAFSIWLMTVLTITLDGGIRGDSCFVLAIPVLIAGLILGGRVGERTEDLQQALDQIRTLCACLPVCMHCHRIHEKDGIDTTGESWVQLEAFLVKHLGVHYSHVLCPECRAKHYPDDAGEAAPKSPSI